MSHQVPDECPADIRERVESGRMDCPGCDSDVVIEFVGEDGNVRVWNASVLHERRCEILRARQGRRAGALRLN